ncbi:MAG: hypothetical protein KC635_05230 [Myxococcales bacterium]|nr:hypothetical protein [Myxococcales bacterium]
MASEHTRLAGAVPASPQPVQEPAEGGASGVRGALRGKSYDEQVQLLAPAGGAPDAGGGKTGDASPAAHPTVLYSNTSDTNLAQNTQGRDHGFAEGVEYTVTFTLDDLIFAGGYRQFPSRCITGQKSGIPRTHNYVNGTVADKKNSPTAVPPYKLVGGPGTEGLPGSSVTLVVANNGSLNLGRLARAAYKFAVAKGISVAGQKPRNERLDNPSLNQQENYRDDRTKGQIDYGGIVVDASCHMVMGNPQDDAHARDQGFVGEYPPDLMDRLVRATLGAVAGMVAAAAGQTTDNWESSVHREDVGMMRPRNSEAPTYQRAVPGEKPVWITNRAEILQRAATRVRNIWVPSGRSTANETYLKDCPDFTTILDTCISECTAPKVGKATRMTSLVTALTAIGAALGDEGQSPMELKIISSKELEDEFFPLWRKGIVAAWSKVSASSVEAAYNDLEAPYSGSNPVPPERPVGGVAPNEEGLITN